jgi:hypothetical protein
VGPVIEIVDAVRGARECPVFEKGNHVLPILPRIVRAVAVSIRPEDQAMGKKSSSMRSAPGPAPASPCP